MTLRALLSLPLVTLVAACGGGGGSETAISGGGGEIFTDTPVEVVQPTTALTRVMADEAAGEAVLTANIEMARGASKVTIGSDLSVTVKAQSGAPRTFRNSEAVIDEEFVRLYRNRDASQIVVVGNAASGTDDTTLDYTAYGVWLKSFTAGAGGLDNPSLIDAGAFVTGARTAAADLPATGSAIYTGDVLALERRNFNGEGTLVYGGVVLGADFATREIEGLIRLATVNGNANGVIVMPTTDISGSSFRSDAAQRDNGDTGYIAGSFMGPGGREIGGVFELNGERQLIGAFGAGLCARCENTAFE